MASRMTDRPSNVAPIDTAPYSKVPNMILLKRRPNSSLVPATGPEAAAPLPSLIDPLSETEASPAASAPDPSAVIPHLGSMADDRLMVVTETAAYIRSSKSFLDKGRLTGRGPPFICVGRKILYRKSAVDAWLSKREFESTSQYTTQL